MITRPHIEFVSPQTIEPSALLLPFAETPLPGRLLVGDPGQGNGAALVRVPPGWSSAVAIRWPYEMIVLEGEVEAGDVRLSPYGYVSAVPGDGPPLTSPQGALLFVDVIADVNARAVIPFSTDGWEDGGMPGLRRKMVRGAIDGPRGFFLRIPAGWSQELTEWHDCAEAALQLEGDLWHTRANHGTGGTMRRHCYFWRPRHILHSPMGSTEGALSWVYVDGHLVNHFVEKGEEPPGQTALPDERRECRPVLFDKPSEAARRTPQDS